MSLKVGLTKNIPQGVKVIYRTKELEEKQAKRSVNFMLQFAVYLN